MSRFVFDIETNGFLDNLDRVHSLVLEDLDSGEVYSFSSKDVETGVRMLHEADLIIGHNIIKYDIPALQKVYPWFAIDEPRVLDTLVLSRLIWPNIKDTDLSRIRSGKLAMTPVMAGSHSLEAWGYRLGKWKGDYAKVMEERLLEHHHLEGLPKPTEEEIARFVWANWSEEMQDYCETDVEVTTALYNLIDSKDYSPTAIELEHQVAWICAAQERNGFGFDREKAERLYHELTLERIQLEEDLRSLFEPWWAPAGKPKTYKKTARFKSGEYREAGATYTPIKQVVFNPGSRDHIADRLIKLRGWRPVELTDGGKPKVDESVLGSLPYPEAQQLAKFFQVKKVLGQLADGDKAWLKYVKDGRIHGSINPNGAVTGRATHSHPNIAQVPSGKAYRGKECRELFGPLYPDHVQVGCDVSGLELRMLAHFMAKYDGGEYGRQVVDGDIHTLNQEAAELPTRDNAKTFIYGFLYGAGDAKIGSIVGGNAKRGKELKTKFLKSLPALKKLVDGVKRAANKNGYLKGLDGRLLHVRSDHAALNTLLQSAGALICKQWLVEFHQLLREHGLDSVVYQMAWVHDEVQLSVPEAEAQRVGDLCVEAIKKAGAFFNIRVPLDGEYSIGANWKETH